MKISIINGSPRSNGATGQMLKEAANYFAEKANEINYIDLAKENYNMCRGCLNCYRTGRCAFQRDGLDDVADKIKASDGILIGSPTYASNITAQLKNFLDRGHFIVEQSLQKKYGFSLSAYEIADGHQVNKIIDKFFLVAGASRSGRMHVKVEHNKSPFVLPKVKSQFHKKLDVFYKAVAKQKRKSLFEKIFTDFVLIKIIWKPIFLKNIPKHAGILEQWQNKKIIERGTVV